MVLRNHLKKNGYCDVTYQHLEYAREALRLKYPQWAGISILSFLKTRLFLSFL